MTARLFMKVTCRWCLRILAKDAGHPPPPPAPGSKAAGQLAQATRLVVLERVAATAREMRRFESIERVAWSQPADARHAENVAALDAALADLAELDKRKP